MADPAKGTDVSERTCNIEGCSKPVLARNWCTIHYRRWRKHGDPHGAPKPPPKQCSIDGCTRVHLSRGWCGLHYGRWAKHGDPNAIPARDLRPKTCTVEGCDKPTTGYGWCLTHYTRWRNTGDPVGLRRTPAEVCCIAGCENVGTNSSGLGWCAKHYARYSRHGDPLATSRVVGDDKSRFWFYVDKDGPIPDIRPDLGRCWMWTGATNSDGYGILKMKRRTAYMPRWSYEHHVEPIPEGLEPDHLCRVRACVNPDHLEPVTHKENVLRGFSPMAINARKTHCIRGHAFDEVNTGKAGGPGGGRRCRACTRIDSKNRARKRSKAS
jgi:hypothetical protein